MSNQQQSKGLCSQGKYHSNTSGISDNSSVNYLLFNSAEPLRTEHYKLLEYKIQSSMAAGQLER